MSFLDARYLMYTVFTSEESCHEDNLRDEKCDGAKGSGNSYAKISSHFRPGRALHQRQERV